MNTENDQNGNQANDSTGEQANEIGGEQSNEIGGEQSSELSGEQASPTVGLAADLAAGPIAGATAHPEGPNTETAAASFGSVLPPNTAQPVGPTEPSDGTQTGIRRRLTGRTAAVAGVGAGLLVGAALGVAGYAIADNDHREPMVSEHQMGRGGGQVDSDGGWSAQPTGRPRNGGPTAQQEGRPGNGGQAGHQEGRNAPRSGSANGSANGGANGGANTGARTQSGGS